MENIDFRAAVKFFYETHNTVKLKQIFDFFRLKHNMSEEELFDLFNLLTDCDREIFFALLDECDFYTTN